MLLMTPEQRETLLENGRNRDKDHPPVIKLFTPRHGCTWLLSELDPEDPSIAFGLCDLGLGFPELGYVSLDEIQSLRDVPIERDLHFKAEGPMSRYTQLARASGRIVDRL